MADWVVADEEGVHVGTEGGEEDSLCGLEMIRDVSKRSIHFVAEHQEGKTLVKTERTFLSLCVNDSPLSILQIQPPAQKEISNSTSQHLRLLLAHQGLSS